MLSKKAVAKEEPKETPKVEAKKEETQESTSKRLYRSETDKVLGGVAGGLGEYFDIDPVLIRIIFVILALSGSGVLLYIILWLVIPSKSNVEKKSEETIKDNAEEIKIKAQSFAEDLRSKSDKHDARMFIGFAVLLLGLILFLDNLGIFHFFRFIQFWPIILILLGIAILSRKK